jgi:mono/diheme cytochrome c family protein
MIWKFCSSVLMQLTSISIIILCTSSFHYFQKFDLKASIEKGENVYTAQCLSCHMDNGEGIEFVFPPLAKSDYLMADKQRSIRDIIYGVSGEMKVNGKIYNGEMPAFSLSDEEVSDVLNYIRNTWGNKGPAVLPSEVQAARE